MKFLRNRSFWFAVIGLVILLALVGSPESEDDTPLSLDSTSGTGTKAMTYLMERFGTEVQTGSVPPPGGRALLLNDQLSLSQTREIERWVENGGTLVVADPLSSLSPFQAYSGQPRRRDSTPAPDCASPLADGVGELDLGSGPTLIGLEGEATTRCFLVDGGHYLMSKSLGRGRVIALAGPQIFVNSRLDRADNAVLVANLLSSPTGTLTVVTPRPIGENAEGEGAEAQQLIPDNAISAFWQLFIASIVFMYWRGRRLGRPVEEPLPIEVPGSALTVALAGLLQTAGRSNAAAHILRRNLRRELAGLLGLQPDTAPSVLAEIASERVRVDRMRLEYLLTDGPSLDGSDLLRLAQELETLHQEVANVR